jgi:hypothetical protein
MTCVAIAWHIHLQRCCTSIIQEIDGHTHVSSIVRIGRKEAAIKVREQVDICTIVFARVQDAVDRDTNVRLGVVADQCSVDQKSQKRVLIGSTVVLEKSSRVVITDRNVGRSLGSREADSKRERKSRNCDSHFEALEKFAAEEKRGEDELLLYPSGLDLCLATIVMEWQHSG